MSLLAALTGAAMDAQQVLGPNVNVISGTKDFITGDPFLRQQNEPSIAVSVRNPEHLLAAANDYRTIEINEEFGLGEPSAMLGMTPPSNGKEAWVGVYRSYDRGKSWVGSLAPGAPNDQSRASLASPSKGLNAGSDPAVVADTAGHFYVGYLAFTRGGNSKIVVARYTDHNNSHVVDTIRYDFTKEVDKGSGSSNGAGSMNGVFLDKLWMAVDHNRDPGASADACGTVYIAYTKFDGVQKDGKAHSSILHSRSTDCGQTWSNPVKLNQPSAGSPNIRNQGVYLVIDPRNGDEYAYWPDYYEPHLLMVRSQDGGQHWTKPVRITANYPLAPYAQPSIGLNSVDSSGQALGTTFRSKSLPAVAIDGDGRHYVAIQEAVGPGVKYGGTTYRSPRITLRITKDPMGKWPEPTIAVMGEGPQVMPAMLANNGLVSLMYYEAVPRIAVAKTLPNGSPLPPGQSRIDDAAGLDPVTHFISGMDREMNVWVAQAEAGDKPNFAQRLAKTTLYAFDPNAPGPDQRTERFFPNLPTNVSGTTPFIGDYNSLAALNFVRADATAPQSAATKTASQTAWRWAMGKNDGPGTVQGIWADTRAVVAPLDGQWQNFQIFPACINPGSRNVNVYTAEISPGIVAGSPQPFGRLRPRDLVKDSSRTFVLYAENRSQHMRRFKFTVEAPSSVASFAQFAGTPALTVEDWVAPFGTVTRTLYAWQGSGSSTAPMRVVVEDVSAVDPAKGSNPPAGWKPLAFPLAGTTILLNPDPNNPVIVDSENHGVSVSAPQQPGPQQPGTSLGTPQQPGPQQPGPQQPGPQQPGSQVGAPQQPGTLVGDATAQVITWTTTGVGDVASAVNSITAITNYAELKDTHDFQLIAYRYLTQPVPTTAPGQGSQYCSINGRTAYVLANVINPNLAPQQPGPQQPGPQQPGPQQPGPQQPGTGIISFYVSPQQPGPQQPGTAVDDGTASAPRQSDEVQVTLIVSPRQPKLKTSNANADQVGGPSSLVAEQLLTGPTFDPNLIVHGDIPAAVDTGNTKEDGPTVTTSFQAPELTIVSTVAGPLSVTAGTRLNVAGLTVSNTGNQPTNASDGNFQTRYYLSRNSLSDTTGDLLLVDGVKTHCNVDPLPGPECDLPPGGEAVSLNASLFIPEGTSAGAYFVKVITDQDNEVAEGTELKAALGFTYTDDNIVALALNVGQPDLVVCGTPGGGPCSAAPANPTPVVITGLNDGATPSPARVLAGGTLTVSPFAVQNQGAGDAYTGSRIDFLLSPSVVLRTDVLAPILAGQSAARADVPLTIPADTPVGVRNVIVRLDATNAFPYETNRLGGPGEGNNEVATPVRVVNPLVAVDDTVATAEDQPVIIHVLANELNPNGDTTTIVSVTTPTRGQAVITDDGTRTTITYTPDATLNGDATFTYTITDSQGQTDTATVTVNVNDRPAAAAQQDAQAVSLKEDATAAITLSGSDLETSNPANLTYTVVAGPTNGVLSGTGRNLTYTPAANYNGPDSFTFTVTDRGDPDNCGTAGDLCATGLTSTPATISIAVAAVNDAPSFTRGPDQNVFDAAARTVPAWATNISRGATDESGQVLNFVITNNTNSALFAVQPEISSDGTLTYTPVSTANGTATITVELHDNGLTANGGQDRSAPQSFSITVSTNRAPVAANDTYTVAEDGQLVVGPINYQDFVSTRGLQLNGFQNPGYPSVQATALRLTTTNCCEARGSAFTTAPVDITRFSTSFKFRMSRGAYTGFLGDGFTFTLQGVGPGALGTGGGGTGLGYYGIQPSVAVEFDIYHSSGDADANHVGINVNGSVVSVQAQPVSPRFDNEAVWTAWIDYNGSQLEVRLCATDACVRPAQPIISREINIPSILGASTAFAGFTAATGSYTVNLDILNWVYAAPRVGVLSNDTDPDGDPLAVTTPGAPAALHGTITMDPSGAFTYTPTPNYNGPDSFSYTVSDGRGGTAVGTVNISVTPVNDAPSAADDAGVASAGGSTSIDVLVNDSDVDGDPLTIQSFTQGSQGSVSLSGTRLNYTPGPGFVGADSFTYIVGDGLGGTATATVRISRGLSAGDVVISEFRFRGSGGGVDQFIELYNNTDAPITVASVDGSSGWAVVQDGGYQVMYLPNGTVIPARGHLLGTQWYSRDQPPGVGSIVHPYAGVAQSRLGSEFNFTWGYYDGHQIAENSGIALFGTTTAANWTFNTRLDAVGFQTSSSLYRMGGGLTPIVVSNTEKSFVRRSVGFTAQNTFNSFSDFVLVSTDTAPIATTTGGSIQPVVGAPGPEHFSAPRYATNVGTTTLVATLLDAGASGTAAPNQIRSGNVLTLRRTLTNTGGTAISRIRLRIVDISTLGSFAGYEADLRARSATDEAVTLSNASSVNVIGARAETIPAQPNGGGLNSGLEIPLPAPLAPGQSIGVQFSFNVITEGTYRINTDVPITPVILPALFLPGATAGQAYTGGTLSAVGAASPTWTLVTGGALLAQYGLTFNSNGTITGTPNAAGSIPLTVRVEDALTGLRAERSYTLSVGGPLDVSPFQMRAVVGEFFSGVRLVGGRGFRQFQLLSPAADIPAGLALDPNVGLSGTPKATGTFVLSFRITDCNLQNGTPSCSSGVAQQVITPTVPITIIAVEQQGFGDSTVQPVAFGGSGGRSLAQVFTSGVGGVLDAIRLNQLSCRTGTQVTVNILQTENSAPFKPFGSPIATGTGYIGLIFNSSIIPLSTPVALSPGLRLAFEVQTDAACAMLRLPTNDNYHGGDAFVGAGGVFEPLITIAGRFDLVFRTMTQQDGLLYTTVPLGWHTATPLRAADGTLNGGRILLAGPNGAAAIYDPATHTLLATGVMRKSRQNHTATLLRCPASNVSCGYDGKVLFTGGKSFPGDGTTIYESSAELFDPAANAGVGVFTDVAGQLGGLTPRARIYHTATGLDDGRILIVGGRSTDGGTTGIQDAEFFDPQTMTFTAGPLDTTRRWQHTATRIAGGKVLVAGGYTAAGTFTSAQIYDPSSGQFVSPSGGGLRYNRGQHTATLLPTSGKVLIAGGQMANALVMTAELFDPAAGSFTDAGNMAEGRIDAAAVALADGATVLVAGGSTGFCCPPPPPLASIERYAAGTWQSAGSMVVVRPNPSLTLLTGGPNGGKVLASSGMGASFVTTQSVELIDPATTLGLATAPPPADAGKPYPNFTLSVTGVAAAFHHIAGSLPPGLTFDDGTGHIHGTVDAAAPAGTYQFGVRIVDTANPSRRGIQTLSIRVLAPFVIGSSPVPAAVTGRSYSQTLTASGGSGARTWTIVSGALPSGLRLASNGVLTGNPTATTPGSFVVTVQAMDAIGHVTTREITVNVGPPVDESEWTNTFPYGGTIAGAGFAVDPGDGNNVFIAAQHRGLYRTTDAGGSWTSVTDNLTNFNVQVGTTSRFFDKSNFSVVRMVGSGSTATLYVVTQNNVFKSVDRGETWSFSGNGINGSVQTLVVAPSSPGVLYAGTFSNGVYQTTDGGANWTAMTGLPLASGSTTLSSIRAIAVDRFNPALVYVGTNDQGVYKFENGGWSQIGGTLLKRVDSLVIKSDPSFLFALGQDTGDGVFRLDLGTSGATWQKATTPTGGTNPFFSAGCCGQGDKIAVEPSTAGKVYVATANFGIWISADGGASLSFQPIAGLQSSTVSVATGLVAGSPVIYVGTAGQGVYASFDGGSDWSPVNAGLRAVNFPHGYVHSLASDATSPSKVYAGSVARGFRSVDGGASWQSKAQWMLPGSQANSIATRQGEPGVVYVFGGSAGSGTSCCFNLWKSDGTGSSFQPISINTGTGNLCCWGDGDIVLHPTQLGTLWVAVSNFNSGGPASGVYKTLDGGATWTLLPNTGLTNSNAHSLTIDPADPNVLYLVVRGNFSSGSAPGGVFRWNGTIWDKLPIIPATQTDQTFNPDQIVVNPGNGDLFVTAQGSSNSGLYRSSAGGANWSRVLSDNVSAVAVDPFNTNRVYVGTWNSGGFRRSSDGGTTWVLANEGLPLQPTIESIVLDPLNPLRVLIATGGGVWVRTFPSPGGGG